MPTSIYMKLKLMYDDYCIGACAMLVFAVGNLIGFHTAV